MWMYSGCKDDQTSADASISGEHVGAMSWAFLQTMQRDPNQSYVQVSGRWSKFLREDGPSLISDVQVLQNTRAALKNRYQQIPQLSVGLQMDLNQPLRI